MVKNKRTATLNLLITYKINEFFTLILNNIFSNDVYLNFI